MKATGIVRRIDDLGRVVIPKEIRRTFRIREGDPLEIYTGSDGEVIFRKYSPIGELGEMATQFADVLWKSSGIPSVITDRERIIAVSGISKKDLMDCKIAKDLDALIEKRQAFTSEAGKDLFVADTSDKKVLVMVPVISEGDVLGSVILLTHEGKNIPKDGEKMLSSAVALFLAKQLEN